MSIKNQVVELLDAAQDSIVNHSRCIKELNALCRSEGANQVLVEHLLPLITHILVVFKREPTVERVVTFLIQFAVSTDAQIQTKAWPIYLMEKLLPYTKASKGTKDDEKTKAIRFRSTQLVAGILNALSDEAEVSDRVWELLETHLVLRASDKVPLIRIQAVLGLSRLQDVEQSDNDASRAVIRLLTTDPNKEVRRTALKNLVASRITLEHIISRTRDVHPDVRQEAYKTLAAKVPIKSLSINQRVKLVQSGLSDRDASTRTECLNMCLQWLKSQQSSIPILLRFFDVENTEDKIIVSLIEALLGSVSLDRIQWKVDTITPELAILWRVFIERCKRLNEEEKMEQSLPENLIEYCELVSSLSVSAEELSTEEDGLTDGDSLSEQDGEVVKSVVSKKENPLASSYILKQVLYLSPFMDKSDEGGRRAILGLLSELCSSTFIIDSDIESMARAIHNFSFGMDDYVNRMYQSLLDSREHLDLFEQEESQILIEKQHEEMLELTHQIDLIKKKKKDSVEELEQLTSRLNKLKEIDTNRVVMEEWCWLRCLHLAEQILSYTTIHDLKSSESYANTINSLIPKFVAPAMSHECQNVRLAALRALGLFTTIDVSNPTQHVALLYHALSHDVVEVQDLALKILFDLVNLSGFLPFFKSSSNIQLNGNSDQLDDENVKGNDLETGEKQAELRFSFCIQDIDSVSHPYTHPESNILGVLFNHLKSPQEVLRSTAVEGFTKLFSSHRTIDSSILSEMIVLLFDPDTSQNETEANMTLQQSLSLFLPVFAFASHKNQELIYEAFVPTIRRILHAPSDSSLANAHLSTLFKFFLHLTDVEKLKDFHDNGRCDPTTLASSTEVIVPVGTKNLHNLIAISSCIELLTQPGSKTAKNLVKIFSSFAPYNADHSTIRHVEWLVERTRLAMKDKASEKILSNFLSYINYPAELPELSESEQEEWIEKIDKAIDEVTEMFQLTQTKVSRSSSSTSVASSRPKRSSSAQSIAKVTKAKSTASAKKVASKFYDDNSDEASDDELDFSSSEDESLSSLEEESEELEQPTQEAATSLSESDSETVLPEPSDDDEPEEKPLPALVASKSSTRSKATASKVVAAKKSSNVAAKVTTAKTKVAAPKATTAKVTRSTTSVSAKKTSTLLKPTAASSARRKAVSAHSDMPENTAPSNKVISNSRSSKAAQQAALMREIDAMLD